MTADRLCPFCANPVSDEYAPHYTCHRCREIVEPVTAADLDLAEYLAWEQDFLGGVCPDCGGSLREPDPFTPPGCTCPPDTDSPHVPPTFA